MAGARRPSGSLLLSGAAGSAPPLRDAVSGRPRRGLPRPDAVGLPLDTPTKFPAILAAAGPDESDALTRELKPVLLRYLGPIENGSLWADAGADC